MMSSDPAPTQADPPEALTEKRQPRPGWPWVIAVTALCFLPFGLIAAYFAWRTDAAVRSGNLDVARRAARAAHGWTITAAVVGLLVDSLIVAILVLLGAFGR